MRQGKFAIVTRCRRSDADVSRSGDVEVRSSGDALQALPQKRYATLEMRCRRCRKRGMQRWRCGACVTAKEVWSAGDALQALPQKRNGALEL